jgi:hypothetical protein
MTVIEQKSPLGLLTVDEAREKVIGVPTVYAQLEVPTGNDNEVRIIAMILELMENPPGGVCNKLDVWQKRRVSKYLYERFKK